MTADLPVLYSFRRCPYAMRARLALQISGLPYELREVVLKNKLELDVNCHNQLNLYRSMLDSITLTKRQ